MKKRLNWISWIFVIPLLTAATIVCPNVAFSQVQQLTVTTDKPSYVVGDTIRISGTIPTVQESTPVIVQIFNSENTEISTETPEAGSDGTYSIDVMLTGSAAKLSGIYTVHVTYGDEDQETTFQFSGEDAKPKQDNLKLVFSGGSSRTIEANLTNGFISNITALEESTTLLLAVDTRSEDGKLTIILPREVIDSKDEMGSQEDNNFAVYVDGDYSDYSETSTTPTDRTLSILVPAGSQEVLIEGSSIMPEFPHAVLLVAPLSMVSIIVLSRLGKTLWPARNSLA